MDWTFTLGSLTVGLLDIISVGLVLLGGITGCAAGFSRVIAKNLGGIFCFPLSLLFAKVLAEFVADATGMSLFWSAFISYPVLCVVIYIAINMLGGLVGDSMSVLGLGVLDSVLGFAWGIIAMAFIVSLLMAVLGYQTFIDFSPLKDNSLLYARLIEPLFPSVVEIVTGALGDIK